MKTYKTYQAAERNAEKMGLRLAEYGTLSSGKGYCYWNESGEAEQCGYVITASQYFQDDDGKVSKQYIDLWITILTVVPTKF